MTEDGIVKKLEDLLGNEKSKGFFNHIIRAYFPIEKVDKVFFKPKEKMKCVLTSETLTPLNNVLDTIDDELRDEFFEYIKLIFDFNYEPRQEIKDLISNTKVSLQGTNTTTYISLMAYRVLFDWVEDKKEKNDKHINWLLKNYDNKRGGKKKGKKGKQNKTNKRSKPVKPTTYSLGDLGVLRELRDKLSD